MTPAVFDARGSVRATCLLRILVGPIVVMHLWPFLAQARAGIYFADSFYVPWLDWMPVPPRELYFALLYLCVATAALMSRFPFLRNLFEPMGFTSVPRALHEQLGLALVESEAPYDVIVIDQAERP